MNLDLARLQTWIGRTESRRDLIDALPVQGLAAMLDRDDPDPAAGDAVPPGGHWLWWFTPVPRQSALGPDGHAQRGGFLPPVPLPRRMWAGSRVEFHDPLRVGDVLERKSTVVDVRGRQGRSGALVFVKVRHEVSNGRALAIVDEQDIVYRDPPRPGDAAPPARAASAQAEFERRIDPDPVLLFRYSALTHNGHRIHYDRPYATGVEGYPGLVVHGPLVATLLLDLLRRHRPGARIATFDFRAVSPLFDGAPMRLCGAPDAAGTVRLWACDAAGALAMEAAATLA